MANITRQKGAADSNPSALKRWLISQLMTRLVSDSRQERARSRCETKRKDSGRPHLVEYFHQVDDGYSHLALQVLERLKATYDIDLKVHLVRPLLDANTPEPQLLRDLSRWDSAAIAPYYGLTFPDASSAPNRQLVDLAESVFASLDIHTLITVGVAISECLWRGDEAGLRALAKKFGALPSKEVSERIEWGITRRAKLKHYSAAMFYYEGEWYWGIDRLSHLERRLRGLAAVREGHTPLIAPKPSIEKVFPVGAREMTLEYFISLRSPYTAVSWQPTLDLAALSGVRLQVRPVLPMVMRGVPATFQKGFYIWKDAYREAQDLGVKFGPFYDPIGKPIEQGYSLYMWAVNCGRGNQFLGAFLEAAFARGVNINQPSGMRRVVEMAGLPWEEAQNHLNDDTWAEILEENRLAMYRFGIWGVPSYRLLDRDGKEVLGVWGQDRLWLVAKKIQELA